MILHIIKKISTKQKIKEFLDLKSNHSRFTAVMKYISNFPLYIIPLNETELTLNIKLLNGTEQNITYFFFVLPDSPQNSLKLEMNNIIDIFHLDIKNYKEEVDDNDNKTTDGAPIQHEHKIRNLLSKNLESK